MITYVYQNFGVCEYMGKYQQAYIKRHTFYLLIFLKVFAKGRFCLNRKKDC